jgi:hypothetical protein
MSYAGIFFDLTGAAFASAASGLPCWHVAAPLVITLVAVLSWSLRPHDKTVTGQAAVASVAGKGHAVRSGTREVNRPHLDAG